MKITKRSLRESRSGQVLIITSLIVVMLLLSTVIYVDETEKDVPIYKPDGNASLSAIKQAAVHTLISALANITNGGTSSVLTEDLIQFKAIAESHSYDAFSELGFTTYNEPPYTNGTLLSWGEDGQGISSIDVAFTLNSSGIQGSYSSNYSVNLTTSINVGGEVNNQSGSLLVTVSCTLLNEGNSASAQNLAVYYKQDNPGGWVPTSPSLISFGNGTYVASFAAQNATLTLLPVSVGCIDARGVTVWANASLYHGAGSS